MPAVGIGTYTVSPKDAEVCVLEALHYDDMLKLFATMKPKYETK